MLLYFATYSITGTNAVRCHNSRIIGQCGRVVQRSQRRTNSFSSTVATVEDDSGELLGEDFDKDIYREMIDSRTDWVVNVQLATGEVANSSV